MREQTGFAEVNGTRLYYEVAGSGHPLVLIHGFTLDTRMWDDQFETFARHYRVVRYDVRGFGKSALPIPSQGYSHAEDLKALLEHLGIAHVYVVGLSMGGGIAINFALECPEATRALIPVDSTLGGFRWSREYRGWLKLLSTTGKESGIEAARDLWVDSPLFKPALEKPDVASRLVQIISDYSGWHFVNHNPVRAPDPQDAQRLDKISAPTLIIVGERDLEDFHAIADALERNTPGARKVILPGVGHMASMEDPDGFNKVVLSFLAGL